MFLGDLSCCPTMFLVSADDAFNAFHRLFECPEGDQAFTDWDLAAKTGILNQRPLPRGKIPNGPVAEPAAARIDINPLGDRELRARILHIPPEIIGGSRDLFWVDYPPIIVPQCLQVFLVSGMN